MLCCNAESISSVDPPLIDFAFIKDYYWLVGEVCKQLNGL